ncbi:MAG: hypothetical protein Q9226_002374 [Calogaya cf. arnoldii]
MKWKIRYSWGVPYDEAQALKSITSQNHSSVRLLRRPKAGFNTATPMFNKGVDLFGLLELVYQDEWGLPDPSDTPENDYETATALDPSGALTVQRLIQDHWVFHPGLFRPLTRILDDTNQMPVASAIMAIKPILRRLQLRRTHATVVPVSVTFLAICQFELLSLFSSGKEMCDFFFFTNPINGARARRQG